MEDLLEEESRDFRSLRRGDVVEGTVISIGRDGVLVDVGSKSEGIIPLGEMHSLGADPLSRVKAGDKVIASVMQPETPEGQVLLSLDRARGERGWRVLQTRFEEGSSFEAEVTGYNKGGLLVNVEGVNSFVPLSQVVGVRPDKEEGGDSSLAQMVGRSLRLKVIEINRRRNRVILSERAAMQEFRSQQKDKLLAELQEGEIRRGRITSVRPFGVFVDLGGADGLAHLSELTWERGKSPEDIYKVGEEVDVFVMKVDPETKKIALSLRRAQPERWEEIVDHYRVGQVVPGRVTKLVTFGAFARIEGPVEGLIHVSELSERRITHPREVVHEGDVVPLKIVRIERDKHRIGLSLRQARDDAERFGWEFNDQGGVRSAPDYVRAEVEAKLGAAPAGAPVQGGEASEPTAPPPVPAPRGDGGGGGAAPAGPPRPPRQSEPAAQTAPPPEDYEELETPMARAMRMAEARERAAQAAAESGEQR
ncbi:MAG: S1 RNA-binding domain-containing protein [Dehalococcoidia bacterium]